MREVQETKYVCEVCNRRYSLEGTALKRENQHRCEHKYDLKDYVIDIERWCNKCDHNEEADIQGEMKEKIVELIENENLFWYACL